MQLIDILMNRNLQELDLKNKSINRLGESADMRAVFKIEVFNALQTRFGPSIYTSLKTTLQNATPN
jgi:hypothetical protein